MESQEAVSVQTQVPTVAARSAYSTDRVSPQQSCPSCAAGDGGSSGAQSSWIYAIGKIEARFPSLSIEKEYAQIVGRSDTKGLTDRQALHSVLTKPENRYLARRICWVMTIEGLETYLLYPRDSLDLSLVIEALRRSPSPADLDIVIGSKGPLAPPELCNGLQVPLVIFDQIYSFDREALVNAIPKPENVTAENFAPVASELFDRIMQMADNAGATDEHRVLNYLAVRYPAVYSTASEAYARNSSLEAINVQTSPLSNARLIMEVIFSFRNRTTDVVEKFFTRVDVTDQFPFLVTKMSPYFDR